MVTVTEGRLLVGSRPGIAGRSPQLEADRVPVSVPSFGIERRLHGGGTPRTAATRDEASAICARESMRLCNELEWERACAGDGAALYPTGDSIDLARCGRESCASPFEVEGLGTRYAEWTASEVATTGPDGRPLAVVRGSASSTPGDHRCAARRLVPASSVDPAIAFRCCTGPAPELSYPAEPTAPVFEDVPVDEARLREALAGVPELAAYASGFRLFRDSERAELITRAANSTPPFIVAQNRVVRTVLKWTPVPGETVWVVAGRSGNTSLVAVLHPLGDGTFAHAASLVLPGDPSTIVVSMREPEARELGFSTCFGCGGEDGEIKLRDDGRFVVVTR